mgnify:FL=1
MAETILCTCARAIPEILARELEALGFPIVAIHAAGVETRGTFEDCLVLNLRLRTAHRVLYRLGSWRVRTPDDMYEAVRNLPWEDWIDADGYVCVVGSIKTSSIDNSQYAHQRCKDGIVDRIRGRKGRRPDAGPDTTQTVVFLFWQNDDCMVYIDTSGTPLSERGYRLQPGRAPLRETLAAAIVLSTRWSPGEAFVNPMCGSGTLAIEAGLIAQNIAPSVDRDNFGFMHVLPYDDGRWQDLVEEARSEEHTDPVSTIIATDRDNRAIDATRANARRAGVVLETRTCDFRGTRIPDPPGVVVLNPEYGLRLGDTTALRGVYKEIGDFFKQSCLGYTGYVFTGNLELAKHIGLRSSRRIPFWTADIESRLVEFELYEGTRKQRSGDDV